MAATTQLAKMYGEVGGCQGQKLCEIYNIQVDWKISPLQILGNPCVCVLFAKLYRAPRLPKFKCLVYVYVFQTCRNVVC